MIRRFFPFIFIGVISSALASPTYLDRFNPPQTRHTIESDVRLIPEFNQDQIDRDYEPIRCKFDGKYYVYMFSGPWDAGFALSRSPLLANEPCDNSSESLGAKYMSYLDRFRTRFLQKGLGSVRLQYQFDNAGTCPGGRVYYWENLYLYEMESSSFEKAIYAIYGAC